MINLNVMKLTSPTKSCSNETCKETALSVPQGCKDREGVGPKQL